MTRLYPVPPGDGRFTHELVTDVASVLVEHDYPDPVVSPEDFLALQTSLYTFCHGGAA